MVFAFLGLSILKCPKRSGSPYEAQFGTARVKTLYRSTHLGQPLSDTSKIRGKEFLNKNSNASFKQLCAADIIPSDNIFLEIGPLTFFL